jgi:Secretion system C-terminal sorting domain/Beta-propeller repeat
MCRIRELIVIVGFFISCTIFAQTPVVNWANNFGGGNMEQGNSIAVDVFGNSYVTGSYRSDTIINGIDTITNAGGDDIFLAKYNPSGSILWVKSLGGTLSDVGRSLAIDNNGNCYLTGYFSSATMSVGSFVLTNNGGTDIFLVKYDNVGNELWVQSGGGSAFDAGVSVSVDSSGNSYLTGNFQSNTIVFGLDTLVCGGNGDIFIVKYDFMGNALWARSTAGTFHGNVFSITCDYSGSSYITGYFSSPVAIFNSDTLFSNGGMDLFIVKFSPMGYTLWAESSQGIADEVGYDITLGGGGSVFVTGSYWYSSAIFGTDTLPNFGNEDIFVAKYDTSGLAQWARGWGGSGWEAGNSITADQIGNCYFTGYFQSSNVVFGFDTLFSNGMADVFVAKYSPFGNMLWLTSAGGSFNDEGYSIALDGNSACYISGYFKNDSIVFGSDTLLNNGSEDAFVVKLDNMIITNYCGFQIVGGMSVFPNPATNNITVTWLTPNVNTFTLLDASGRAARTYNVSGTQAQLSLEGLASGVYFLSVGGETKSVQKIIKQ